MITGDHLLIGKETAKMLGMVGKAMWFYGIAYGISTIRTKGDLGGRLEGCLGGGPPGRRWTRGQWSSALNAWWVGAQAGPPPTAWGARCQPTTPSKAARIRPRCPAWWATGEAGRAWG